MSLPERLVVAPRFRVHTVEPSTVVLSDEIAHVGLDSRFALETLARCRAPIATSRLREELRTVFSAPEVLIGLRGLVERRLLVDAGSSETHDTGAAAFWSRLGVESQVRTSVSVRTVGGSSTTPLRDALAQLGIDVVDSDVGLLRTPDLEVVAVDDVLDPRLESINEARLHDGRRWAIFKPSGVRPWLGPLLAPRESGCWACLSRRLWDNEPVRGFLRGVDPASVSGPVADDSVPVSRQIAAGLMALRVQHWLRAEDPEDPGTLLTVDLRDLATSRHHLAKLPDCEACGTPARWAPGRPRLEVAASVTDDGGHRSMTAEETWRRLERHVDPLLGVVRRVERLNSGGLLPTFRADHVLFEPGRTLTGLQESLISTTAGKGRTAEQARVSAVCEAIERWSGRFRGHEVDCVAAWSGLDAGRRAVHPRELLHFSRQQYAERSTWNAQHADFARIPETFDDDREVPWTSAWSLTRDEPVLVPTAYAFYNVPTAPGHAFCSADSNGCAAGNSLLEAVLQGLLELIERDAVATWWYNRLESPAVDLDSLDDPLLAAVRGDLALHNRTLWVLDLTSDLDVPTFAAVSARQDSREEIVQGYGAHVDPYVAIWRAITETSQMLAHLEGVDLQTVGDVDLRTWYEEARLVDHPYLAPGPLAPLRPRTAAVPLRSSLDDLVEGVGAAGMEVLVLDQSRPEVPLHVVKVIVPGLRHFWPRFAPGRLYDVPVRLGRRAAPCPEEDLNPVPITT